jgi:subtilisin family serine protease
MLAEPLEARCLLSAEPWGLIPQLIGQDRAAELFADYTGAGQTVAVIDTGVDYAHPLLGGGFGEGFKVVGGYDFVDDDADPMDTYGHGTHVAGVIAADEFGYAGRAYRGIAPQAQLVALRIDSGNEPVPDERIEAALRWVLDNRATYNITVVNISFGYGSYSEATVSPVFGDELEGLASAGVFVVAASGNGGVSDPPGIQTPAADPNVFAVGSVSAFGTISEFTARSALLDMLAPGEDVPTTALNDGEADVSIASGTSFAVPFVVGTAVLIRQVDPTLALGDVRSILRASATEAVDGDDEFGATTDLTLPLLNTARALALTMSRRGGPLVNTGDVAPKGNNNELAFDDEGVLHLAYYDSRDSKLKYRVRSQSGSWSDRIIIDESAPFAGQYVSMALDRFGRPAVAYFIGQTGDLKYASLDGETWNVQTVDWKNSTGLYPSLVFNRDGRPAISYYYKGGHDLKLVHWNGAAWHFVAVDVSDAPEHDVGRSTSIAIDKDGRMAISYEDSKAGHLRFARELIDGTWRLDLADDATQGLAWTSVGFDGENKPIISYYDASPANLKFARYSTSRGWETRTLASKGAQGLFSALAIEESGTVNVLYYNRQLNQIMRAREEPEGWVYQRLQTGGGRYISADIDGQGRLAYSWFQSDNRLLHVELIQADPQSS